VVVSLITVGCQEWRSLHLNKNSMLTETSFLTFLVEKVQWKQPTAVRGFVRGFVCTIIFLGGAKCIMNVR
jgi:hypothetical protein